MVPHSHEVAIMGLAKMVMNAGNSKSSGNSKDTTPPWVIATINRVEADLADSIAKCKKKEPQFKRFLVHNRDEKRWEVHQNGYFGRTTLVAAAEYRKEAEHYL